LRTRAAHARARPLRRAAPRPPTPRIGRTSCWARTAAREGVRPCTPKGPLRERARTRLDAPRLRRNQRRAVIVRGKRQRRGVREAAVKAARLDGWHGEGRSWARHVRVSRVSALARTAHGNDAAALAAHTPSSSAASLTSLGAYCTLAWPSVTAVCRTPLTRPSAPSTLRTHAPQDMPSISSSARASGAEASSARGREAIRELCCAWRGAGPQALRQAPRPQARARVTRSRDASSNYGV